ncbi:MAG: GNAT family N-acetyltransferase [Bacteroidales bacterium]|nr:GNAT family N-acetyltransferase [Bacteroidales bacterium]
MKAIISAVDRKLLKDELTEEKFIRETNNGNNLIYIISYHDSPNLMTEIGRLREITFRDAGGGTGKKTDIDIFDTQNVPFKQLIVWNPEDEEIVGGYRFILGRDIPFNEQGELQSPTSKLFRFSQQFIDEYLDFSIELGRSFVQPLYQPTYNIRKGMYSLDNVWDGLGAIIIQNPDIKYLFGKITMYPHINLLARDLILFFLGKYFPDPEKLIEPHDAVIIQTDKIILENIFTGKNYDEDYKTLMHHVRGLKENIPPLVNAYMNLSSTMRTFGTSVNHNFGNVEETGIIVTIKDIYEFKKERHISTYKK